MNVARALLVPTTVAAVALVTACTSGGSTPTRSTSSGRTSSAPQSAPPVTSAASDVPSQTVAPGSSGAGSPTSSPPASTTPPPVPSPSLSKVNVVVTYALWNASAGEASVSGYAAIATGQGTCSLVLTQNGVSRTASRAATLNVDTTSCGVMTIPRAELAPGTWGVTVTFSSPTSTGSASGPAIEVPQ